MQCDFCESKEIVLIIGYKYCRICSHQLERIWIHNILLNRFPTFLLPQIHQLCIEMFETEDYCYAAFQKLYKIIDRGEIDKRTAPYYWYKIPMDEYLIAVFKKFIQSNHPRLIEKLG